MNSNEIKILAIESSCDDTLIRKSMRSFSWSIF